MTEKLNPRQVLYNDLCARLIDTIWEEVPGVTDACTDKEYDSALLNALAVTYSYMIRHLEIPRAEMHAFLDITYDSMEKRDGLPSN